MTATCRLQTPATTRVARPKLHTISTKTPHATRTVGFVATVKGDLYPGGDAGRRTCVLARLLGGSVVLTWPALLMADEFAVYGGLSAKADDFMTGAIVALLIAGLLAAGWLKPLRVVLGAV